MEGIDIMLVADWQDAAHKTPAWGTDVPEYFMGKIQAISARKPMTEAEKIAEA